MIGKYEKFLLTLNTKGMKYIFHLTPFPPLTPSLN